MNGLDALAAIMADFPRPVVMLSAASTGAAADITIRALELGAVDFVHKPSGNISLELGSISDRILDALRAAAAVNMATVSARGPVAAAAVRHVGRKTPGQRGVGSIVAVAASTGGPRALADVLPRLPENLDAAILVVQHMPAGFSRSFANRLNTLCALAVCEAEQGDQLQSGRVYIAPGGYHMTLHLTDGVAGIALDQSPPVWGVRPSADPLFKSVARSFGRDSVGVVLTGMGRDGADGLHEMRQAGGRAIVQDEESSVIYGMPQAALNRAGADRVAALAGVATCIEEMLRLLRNSAA
jgi:two-component system chemotaxis response regulator CheB